MTASVTSQANFLTSLPVIVTTTSSTRAAYGESARVVNATAGSFG